MKFKNEYRCRFDAVRPDPDLRRRIEERMEAEMRNEKYVKRRAPLRMSRRLAVALAAALILALAATAVAVVQGNLLRTKLEEQGDESIAARVQDVHVADAGDGFGFTVDEVVWEDDQLYASYAVSVPDDGESYLYGIYVPELNGQRMEYSMTVYMDAMRGGTSRAYPIGGKFETAASGMLKELYADPALKERTDNALRLRVAFFRANRPIEGVADWDAYLAKMGWVEGSNKPLRLPNSDVLYYQEDDAQPCVFLDHLPEVAALFPELPESGWVTLSDDTDMTLTAEDIASTGLVELVAERELTVPLDSSGAQDTVYNDLAQHEYPMDGYTVVITDFHLTHFVAKYKGYIRKDGDLIVRRDENRGYIRKDGDGNLIVCDDEASGDPLEDEPIARYYELLRPDGSPLAGEEDFTMYGCDLTSDEEGREIIAMDGEVRGVIPLDDLPQLLLAPVEYETAPDGEILSKNYLLDEALTLEPIHNPDKSEPTEEPDYGAAEGDDLSQ